MKNFGKIMALFAAVFMFSSITLSCSSDSGSDDDNDDDKGTGNVLLDQKIEKYMSYLGEYEGVEDLGGNCFVKNLKLEEKSITIDGTRYSFNPETGEIALAQPKAEAEIDIAQLDHSVAGDNISSPSRKE